MYRTVARPDPNDMPEVPTALSNRLTELARKKQEDDGIQRAGTTAGSSNPPKASVPLRPLYNLHDFWVQEEMRRMAEESDEIRQYVQELEEYRKKEDARNDSFHSPWVGHLHNDGTFHIYDVPAGNWTFIACLMGISEREGGRPVQLAQLGFRMTAPSPPQDLSTGTLHLGSFRMTPSGDELQRQGVRFDDRGMGHFPTGEAFQYNYYGSYIQLRMPKTVEESQGSTLDN